MPATLVPVMLAAICWCAGADNATLFDASPSQRREAFSNVSVPVTNVSVPFLRNVTAVAPNATLVYRNDSQGGVESAGAYDYPTALGLTFRYFAAERLGALPAGNDVPWRAGSFLDDPVPGGLGDAVRRSSTRSSCDVTLDPPTDVTMCRV